MFGIGKKRMHDPGSQISVIMQRQVPIRFQEPARSWLGGLPMMPKFTKWPRDAEGAPLHFVAQLDCSDLPVELWNGYGPRKGWLLLFVETLKLEDEASDGSVQVLHTKTLGNEREPPKDAPTVRHTMSDYIDYTKPNIRPGVPKLWRKWPVDLVVQEYDLDADDNAFNGPPDMPARQLYDAAVSDLGTLRGGFDFDRPLTWRGALYVLEGVRRDLKPDDFARNFIDLGGLLEPPEPDQDAFNKEFQRRAEDINEAAGVKLNWMAGGAAREDLTAKIKAERRTGWMLRAFSAIDVVQVRLEGWRDTYQQDIDSGLNTLSDEKLHRLREKVQYQIKSLEELQDHRDYLNELFSAYPNKAGEAAFNAQIEDLGKAHLAWGARLASAVQNGLTQVLAQDLDAPIPDDAWSNISSAFAKTTSTFWQKTYDTRVLTKVERSLSFKNHVEMAIREDFLDLYTRSQKAASAIPPAELEKIEQKVRYIEHRLPHRIGGLANPVQGDADPSQALVFQIASDHAMGWMWGDLGALYVSVAPTDLRRNRWGRVNAWIEGH